MKENNFFEFQKLVRSLPGRWSKGKQYVFFENCGDKYQALFFPNGSKEPTHQIVAYKEQFGDTDSSWLINGKEVKFDKLSDDACLDDMDKIAKAVDALIYSGKIPDISEYGEYEITCDDSLGADEIKEIVTSDDPSGAYNEIIENRLYDELSNGTSLQYVMDEIASRFDDDVAEAYSYLQEEAKDYVWDCIYWKYDPKAFNDMLRVDLLIDSGNWDYECNCDSRESFSSPERQQCSSLLFLADLVGKKKELISAINGERAEDPFVMQCIEELDNAPDYMTTVTALVQLPMRDIVDILCSQHEGNGLVSGIRLQSGTLCGLFDPMYGDGSVFGIRLPDAVELPVKNVRISIDGCSTYKYNVDKVYGMVSAAWTKAQAVRSTKKEEE